MHRNLSHQDLARERHAQLLRNASIRYLATVSYAPSRPEPERKARRRSVGTLLRRVALAG